ncbi:N-acetylmuramoyl-L-alanine amidase [Streptomyces sp. J2-1]|uniref:N-acetylmuramoyl-L-alanine amidase n=1 Tax=Streptomyces corallincola TaxID=2851888 RepID=UPI001C3873B7|nr:peptidoglycan recognition family protein [Streptomyces corallincola]MBV2352788.1 N-acetylmuramoyl-L-alanine amidase [Streptomyces corallincola]
MKKRVTPRVPGALRGHRGIICVTASAALLAPLLIDATGDGGGPTDLPLQDEYAAAADEYHVPRSILLGVSYLQSRWDSHQGSPSVVGGYGPMHLVDGGTPKTAPERPGGNAPVAVTAGQPAPTAGLPADLHRAASLTGLPVERLRTDNAANLRGGAALLAATQRQLGKPLSANPQDWWDAVARFPGSGDRASATAYANDVFELIHRGVRRTTDAGQRVTLAANPAVRPRSVAVDPGRPKQVECPPEVACSWLSAPLVQIDEEEYGNHQLADRPRDQGIDYIVIHDTEAPLASMLMTIQDPEEASWHYSLRSSDGHITQHIPVKDAAWHSGSQFVNARSIGIEHEGFLRQPDAWFTEEMYRSSARLVRYLADKYRVPLDRQHIFGHDNVPSPTEDTIADMHDDPGPFWDWRHYFDLLGAPLKATAGPDSDMLMILPDYKSYKPAFTGCARGGVACAPHGSSSVLLRTEPRDDAPFIQDPGRHPDGEDTSDDIDDIGSRVSAGQTFAVAGRSGEWTAIWYQGRRGWFRNPAAHPAAVGAKGRMITPKPGSREIPVYGRAMPEESAYPEGVDEQTESPLPYTLREGQRYVTQSRVLGSFMEPASSDSSPSEIVKGNEAYYEIQLGHRLAYVRASDVDVLKSSVAAAGPAGKAAKPGR